MTTFLTDKCTEIRNWLAIGPDVYPDPVVTGWIRMAEEDLSTTLRVKHMVQIDYSTLTNARAPLPLDWQEIRLARLLNAGGTLRYQTPDAFFNPEFPQPPGSPMLGYEPPAPGQQNRYTILGNYIVVGVAPSGGVDTVAGTKVELTYYQNIPPLTDDANNWINVYHPTIYMLKILNVASMYAIEDPRCDTWGKEVTRLGDKMNAVHKVDMASGSVLMPRMVKTFG